jgi:hypothetical protein
MPAQPWTKAQAMNNKKFQARLDRITNYLIEGDWRGSYSSKTFAEGDDITNFIGNKGNLPSFSLEFSRLQGGALQVERSYKDEFGKIISEGYIVGVQPFEGAFYMLSTEDNDIVLGDICKKSGVLSLTLLEQGEPGDEAFLGIEQYTNLSA